MTDKELLKEAGLEGKGIKEIANVTFMEQVYSETDILKSLRKNEEELQNLIGLTNRMQEFIDKLKKEKRK